MKLPFFSKKNRSDPLKLNSSKAKKSTDELSKTLDRKEVRLLLYRYDKIFSSGREDEDLIQKAYQIASKNLSPQDAEYELAFSRLASVAIRQNQNKKAVKILAPILPHAEATLGPADIEFITILNNLSIGYWRSARPDLALPLMKRAVEAKRLKYGAGNFEYFGNLQDLILILEDLGSVAETEPYVREMLEMKKLEFGTKSPEYVRALENLARVCRHTGHEAECQDLLRKAKETTVQFPSPDELEKQARRSYAKGDFVVARRLHRRILTMLPPFPMVMENLFDPLLSYVDELEKKGTAAEKAQNFDVAANSYEQIVEIIRTAGGELNPRIAYACSNLAIVRQKQNRMEEAKDLYRTAIELMDLLEFEPEKRSIITANLAELFKAICDQHAPEITDADTLIETYGEAASGKSTDFARAIRIRFPVPIPGETTAENTARWINARAKYYESIGDHNRARFLYERELELLRMVCSNEPEMLFQPINDLVHYYLKIADYAAADSLMADETDVVYKVYGLRSLEFAQVQRDRGHLLIKLSNFSAAEQSLLEARQIVCALEGDDSPNVATLDDDLLVIRLRMGRRQEAKVLLPSVIKRFEQRPEFDAVEAQRIATFLTEFKEYPKAEELYRKAQDSLKQSVGKWDPSYALTMSNIGTFYRQTGRFEEAAKCFKEATEIREAEFGSQHQSVAESKIRLAIVLASLGQFDEALEATRHVLRIEDNLIADVSALSSQRQLTQLLMDQHRSLTVVFSLIRQLGSKRKDFLQTAYEVVLRRKGLSAEALASRRLPIIAGRYPHLKSKLEELDQLVTLLTQAHLSKAKSSAEVRRRAEKSREDLEAELSKEIHEMRFERHLSKVTVHQIASCLPPGSVLIDYIRVALTDFSAVLSRGDSEILPARYLAFVLHAGAPGSLSFVDLGEAEEIDEKIALLGGMVGAEATYAADRNLIPINEDFKAEGFNSKCISIRERILDPLLPLLDGKTRILLVPDGPLFSLPFDILPTESGGSIIDEFNISFLGRGRDVVRYAEHQEVRYGPPVIVAGPNYSLPQLSLHQSEGAILPKGRGAQAKSLQELGLRFAPLAGAEAEGREIGLLLNNPSILGGTEAKESAFRRLNSPMLLHLATHGFFFSNTASEDQPDNGMLNSGLALAGANNYVAGEVIPPDFEDGILTAEDVATLNLFETDLAVLSACQTGAGNVIAGEGVFGLRRALFAAGVRTTVMTLWTVPDIETKELMVNFYRALQRGVAKPDALRVAKLAIRELHAHPFYWGSFICEGDWMPARRESFADFAE